MRFSLTSFHLNGRDDLFIHWIKIAALIKALWVGASVLSDWYLRRGSSKSWPVKQGWEGAGQMLDRLWLTERWGEGSTGRVPTVPAWGLGFRCPVPVWRAELAAGSWNLSREGGDTGWAQGLTGQPGQPGQRASGSVRPCLLTHIRWGTMEESRSTILTSGLCTFACTCAHTRLRHTTS